MSHQVWSVSPSEFGRIGRWNGNPESAYMGIIAWANVGLIAGIVGSKIVAKQSQGFPLNIALGIVGAVVGGFLFDLIGASGGTALKFWSAIAAIVGSRPLCC